VPALGGRGACQATDINYLVHAQRSASQRSHEFPANYRTAAAPVLTRQEQI